MVWPKSNRSASARADGYRTELDLQLYPNENNPNHRLNSRGRSKDRSIHPLPESPLSFVWSRHLSSLPADTMNWNQGKKRRHDGWALAGTPFALRGNELNLGQAAPRAPSWLALQWCSLPWVWSSKNKNEEAAHRRKTIGKGWLLTIPLTGENLVHSTAENKWVIHDFSVFRIEHVSIKTDAFWQDLCIRGLRPTIGATVQKVKFWSTPKPLSIIFFFVLHSPPPPLNRFRPRIRPLLRQSPGKIGENVPQRTYQSKKDRGTRCALLTPIPM
jgi:hypothetical protein